MQELIKKLNRRYTMSMFVTSAMMYDTMNNEREEAAAIIKYQATEIAELDALRNDAVLRLDKYKSLCDQMAQVIQMSDGCLYKPGEEALEAWRAMK